jgi:hypothetical protein
LYVEEQTKFTLKSIITKVQVIGNLIKNKEKPQKMYNETLISDNLVTAIDLSAGKENNNKNPVFERLAAEGCESYFDYVRLLGLEKDPNIIALSSLHHYYWDAEDLREVRTVVNLEQLNQVKQIRTFLLTINNILSHQSYFIGSFTDSRSRDVNFSGFNTNRTPDERYDETMDNGITLRYSFLNIMNKITDKKTNRVLTKRSVMQLLDGAGLEVLDMTVLNGLTYFCTNKVRAIA